MSRRPLDATHWAATAGARTVPVPVVELTPCDACGGGPTSWPCAFCEGLGALCVHCGDPVARGDEDHRCDP